MNRLLSNISALLKGSSSAEALSKEEKA
jgi:hypothetical protein